ncbi:hypothetical protein SBV1_60016 [Verrucomicrobia bacterium]|nr:hypothetical protein SBV1_60016 [Verrucomicrobiota bacterium]
MAEIGPGPGRAGLERGGWGVTFWTHRFVDFYVSAGASCDRPLPTASRSAAVRWKKCK